MGYNAKVYRKQGGAEQVIASGGTQTVESGGKITVADDNGIVHPYVVHNRRFRVTQAQINAGLELLPAIPGYKYRMVDAAMIAIGGNAATATSVDILATQAATGVKLVAAAVAGLTQSAVARAGAANIAVLADGASHAPCDVNTAITIGKTGSNLATATNVDVILSYTIEP